MLILANTVLSFGPHGAHDIIYVRFKTVYVFGNTFSDERRGLFER
jgi:hypothetical protein